MYSANTTITSSTSSSNAAARPKEEPGTPLSAEDRRLQAFLSSAVPGPSIDTKPDYDNIVGPLGRWVDRLLMTMFRQELAAQVLAGQEQSSSMAAATANQQQPAYAMDDYRGIIELAATMNRDISNRTEIHTRAQTVLSNLFPSWMPVRRCCHRCRRTVDGIECFVGY